MNAIEVAAAQLRASVPGSSSGIFDDLALSAPTVTVPGPTSPTVPKSVLILPAQFSAQPEYVSSYLTLSEYLGPVIRARNVSLPDGFWVDYLVSQHPRNDMLEALAMLGGALAAGHLSHIRDLLRAWVLPDILAAIDTLPSAGGPRAVVTRQGIHLAARAVIKSGTVTGGTYMPVVPAALLLAEGALDGFESLPPASGTEFYPGMDAELAHETIMNMLFHASDDPAGQLERSQRLWTSFPPRGRAPLRASPNELLVEATGIDSRAASEFGLCIWASLMKLPQMQAPYLPTWDDMPFEPEVRARVLDLVAASPEDLAKNLPDGLGPWAFLPFEQSPVLLLDGQPPLVLDQVFLWRRLSTGLFYPVLDNERDVGGLKASRAWATAFGDMNEQFVDDLLRRLAIPYLDGGLAHWDGDTLKAAFGKPGHSTSDGALLFGETAIVVEIVSRGITLEARTQGDLVKLLDDNEKQLWKKISQLDSTIKDLVTKGASLPGWPAGAVRLHQPLLVQGREFTMTPITHAYIESEIKTRGLFAAEGTLPLAVITIAELEMLLAISEETKETLPELVRAWTGGARRGWPLGNHLLAVHSDLAAKLRPPHAMAGIKAMFAELEARAKP